MKVKKYTAPSMPEAMKHVRNELGNDAVILNSRIVYSGGFLGFFRRKNIEVIAAVDPTVKQDFTSVLKDKQKMLFPAPPNQEPETGMREKTTAKTGTVKTDSKQSEDILKEINQLKELIKSQSFQSAPLNSLYPKPIQKALNWMNAQEFSGELKEKFTASLMEKWGTAGLNTTDEEVQAILKTELKESLSEKSLGGISFLKKYVNVVGPTGVGKTTTLAKIAADCVLNHQKKVAFITTDTYRIAAIEQLKTYAQILNIPIEVCYSIDDFQAAANKFSSYDVVLIDTAGRNFRNKQYVEDLFNVINFKMEMETYLVLSLTSKQKDMEEIFQQFSSITIDKFVFTKADETSSYGSIMNLVDKYKIGVAYITTGQNVPDDVVIASPDTITNLLLGDK